MKDQRHLLISLESRHAANILAGTKHIELRRRRMHVNEGDLVWLYVKKPVAAVVGCAVVGQCTTDKPAALWKQFGSVSGLMRSEFMTYLDGTAEAFAMGIRDPKPIKRPVSLADLRSANCPEIAYLPEQAFVTQQSNCAPVIGQLRFDTAPL